MTLRREFESRCSHTNYNFSLSSQKKQKSNEKSCPTSQVKWRTIYSWGLDFTVDEGNGQLNTFRDKNSGKRRRRKVEKSCVTFLLLCDPGWSVLK